MNNTLSKIKNSQIINLYPTVINKFQHLIPSTLLLYYYAQINDWIFKPSFSSYF